MADTIRTTTPPAAEIPTAANDRSIGPDQALQASLKANALVLAIYGLRHFPHMLEDRHYDALEDLAISTALFVRPGVGDDAEGGAA